MCRALYDPLILIRDGQRAMLMQDGRIAGMHRLSRARTPRAPDALFSALTSPQSKGVYSQALHGDVQPSAERLSWDGGKALRHAIVAFRGAAAIVQRWHEQERRNVKRWRGGEMPLRWIGAALAEARRRLRAVRGYRGRQRLATAPAQGVADTVEIRRKAA